MSDTVELWIDNPMFAAEGRAFCDELALAFPARGFAPGELIVAFRQPVSALSVVLRGTVRVFHQTRDGRATLVKLLSAPVSFGEMELLHDLPYMESVAALDDVLLARIPKADYLRILAEHPAVMVEQLRNLAGAFCVAARNERQIFAPLEQRVAELLLALAEIFGRSDDDRGLLIDHPLSVKSIAESLGVTQRGVAKVFAAWREKDLIGRQAGQLLLCQPDALERLAAPIRGSLRFFNGMPLTPILGDAPDVRAELVVHRGPAACRGRRAVVGEQLLVGRGAHCSLLLPDETVSPSHCRVFRSRTGNRYWVEDLESLNGTRVNDREINRRTVLHDGDRLALGRTTLAFNLLGH